MENPVRILVSQKGMEDGLGYIKEFKEEKGLNPHLSSPVFKTPGGMTAEEYFDEVCQKELRAKFGEDIPKTVLERYEKEKSAIFNCGYTNEFLQYKLLMDWAQEKNIYLSVDRGSAVGSLVCYLLGLTKINPLKYNLIFERFINKERLFSHTDLEFDVESGKKAELIEHIINTFGAENCAFAAEFSYPFTFKDDKDNLPLKTIIYVSNEPLKNQIPLGRLDKTTYISSEPQKTFDLSKCLKFIINPSKYLEFFKKADADADANDFTEEKAVFSLITDNEILKKLLAYEFKEKETEYYNKINPQNIEDLAAVFTLLREPVIYSGITDDFINSKNSGRTEDFCEVLRPVLKDTYGEIIWQEQVIQILNIVLGYSLEKSDIIRRSLAKQQISPELKKSFIDSAQKLGMSKQTAKVLWDKTEKAAPYCFIKSHAISWALMIYYSALWSACLIPPDEE